MEQHEREFFICQIRLGRVKIQDGIEVMPFTLEQELEASEIYNKSYDRSLSEEIMTTDEMEGWMYEAGIWDHNDAAEVKLLEQDIESSKEKIYEARNDKRSVAIIRAKLRSLESKLAEKNSKKHTFFSNTCEGLAESERINWLVSQATFKNNKPYDFEEYSLDFVLSRWHQAVLSEHDIRDLVLNDPWRSLWNIRENAKIALFKDLDKFELTHNQKHILVWSQIYDNIQESPEAPQDNVIKDHDMLDGWFISQNKKRAREKSQSEFDKSTNEKIKNSSEVFVMAKTGEDVKRINNMNDNQGKAIKKERSALIQKKRSVEQHEFRDEIIDQTRRQNNMFMDKFRR